MLVDGLRNKTMKKIGSIIFILFLSFGAFAKNSYAEDQNVAKGFSVNPFFQEVNLEKDQADATIEVEIANNTGNLAVLKLSVLDFGALDETGGVAFLGDSKDLTNKYSLASWISLEKDGLVIGPGEKQVVKATIQNKESLSPGGHYAAILAKLDVGENSSEQDSSKVALNSSFSSLIFARKLGGEVYGLTLKEQEITKGVFGLPTTARLRFQNTGNVYVTPRGVVTLTDPMGREVARGIIDEESALVLPETFRVFPTQMREMAMAFVPGRYNLSTQYRYDGQDDFVTVQQNIFIIPNLDVWALLAVIVIIYISFKIKRRKK